MFLILAAVISSPLSLFLQSFLIIVYKVGLTECHLVKLLYVQVKRVSDFTQNYLSK
jgi:hypothetical protein